MVATGRSRSQIRRRRKPQNQAQTVAVGCHQLPFGAHGKGRVDATSLFAKEGVTLLAPQELESLRTRRPRPLGAENVTANDRRCAGDSDVSHVLSGSVDSVIRRTAPLSGARCSVSGFRSERGLSTSEPASGRHVDERRPGGVIPSGRQHERRQLLVADERVREPTMEDQRYRSSPPGVLRW